METLHSKDIDLGLERFQDLLLRLGHPQDDLPPVIHVAGTNGKGSTIAFLRAMFETVGYRVHAFTSPHMITPHDGIIVDGEEISEKEFTDLLEEVIRVNDGASLTVFEAITAVAFLAFARTKGHIVLLETGLGGLGDTTNVVEEPALTVITPISMDHTEFLGETLGEIATQKAGILKENVPCVMAAQDQEAYQAVRARVKELNIPFYREGRDWFVKRTGRQMVFEGWDGDYAWPLPNLAGEHQIHNAGLALACLEALKDRFQLPSEAVRSALQTVDWRGRLEQVDPKKLLPKNWELWLDGGHNVAAAQVLRKQIKKWNDQPIYLVFGMLKRKDSKAFLAEVAGIADHVYTVEIPDQKSKKPSKLAGQVQDAGGLATACEDLALAFELIKAERKDKNARVLVCGSLYLLSAFYDLHENA
ncbi:folylpolyglutamate synthase/dihydrofolate synthase family protein [Terasakiella sp. A23]|uniref:bifunctional folylpolyglutamate synthase/dihydrofolate synthase n=1 Tax=Terasakiella sp. FCG-A23 TaxID=3080561 RepID=UPI00295374D6|nr:folylpolyglutamate synthase/dihydrofolate synthase family protein [Terasakiella sp. A23]MDV7339950.1 folylpolyglutamate synthase/dihydrofolate synthase family protein [Terasakiella sp. A23]